MDEFEIIERIFAPLAAAPGAFELKDDAAAIPARPGYDLIVTTDQIAEGTDFFPGDPPKTIAQKALRVNLSDLAAKGAIPFGYLLNLTVPDNDLAWFKSFASGLAADQEEFEIGLLGGDTAKGARAIAVTAFGYVPEKQMVRRNSARPGEAVYVSGTVGDSGGGLAILRGEKPDIGAAARNYLIDAYRLPKPPVRLGWSLRHFAKAAADISDGLIADLTHIADASGVCIEIDAERIPRSSALRALWGDGLEAILRAATAGDDYQIAFTADPGAEKTIEQEANTADTLVTRIGSVRAGQGVVFRHAGKAVTVPKVGYRHF